MGFKGTPCVTGIPTLFVHSEQIEGPGPVGGGQPGVPTGRLKSGRAEQLGKDDEVGAATHQGRGEGVTQDVRGHVVIEPGPGGDGGDDVVDSLDRQRSPCRLRNSAWFSWPGQAGVPRATF